MKVQHSIPLLSFVCAIAIQTTYAWRIDESAKEIEKNIMTNRFSHDIYFDLTRARSSLADVIAQISLWDDNKDSVLWQLHEYIIAGNTRAPRDIVLEALADAEIVVLKKSKQLSADTLRQINDMLDQLADTIEGGFLDAFDVEAYYSFEIEDNFEVVDEYSGAIVRRGFCGEPCEKPCKIECKRGPRGHRGHRGHRGSTGPTGATGATGTFNSASCVDNICTANLTVTNCIGELCVLNLSVVDESITGPLSTCDVFVGCDLFLHDSISPAIGNVIKNGQKFIHTFPAGSQNTFVGTNAGNFTMTGGQNVGVGPNALTSNTTGINNVAVGLNALATAPGSFENVAIGNGAMQFAVALDPINNPASSNIAIGFNALQNTNSGQDSSVFDQPCIAIGSFALQNNSTGFQNIAIGQYALKANTVGSMNIAVGTNVLANNVTGASNTGVGDYALANNTSSSNTAVGSGALTANITGSFNTAVGAFALQFNTDSNNTAVGDGALSFNTSGTENTAVGVDALQNNTTGSFNTALGHSALVNCITGTNNVGIGENANASGDFNVIVGATAGNDGSQNVGVGFQALSANESDHNVAVGYNALQNISSVNGDNTAVGYQALQFAQGASNIAVGSGAGSALGLVGSNDIYIGNAGVAAESAAIRIGTLGTQTTCFIQGIHGVTTGLAAIPVLVDGNGQLGTVSSSIRFKHDINEMGADSEVIYQLNPVTFVFNNDMSETKQYGLIAEEVAQVFPAIVVTDPNGQPYTVQYQVLPVLLLNELIKHREAIELQNFVIEDMNNRLMALEQQY